MWCTKGCTLVCVGAEGPAGHSVCVWVSNQEYAKQVHTHICTQRTTHTHICTQHTTHRNMPSRCTRTYAHNTQHTGTRKHDPTFSSSSASRFWSGFVSLSSPYISQLAFTSSSSVRRIHSMCCRSSCAERMARGTMRVVALAK